MRIRPLYTGFTETHLWKAFILNAVANSIIIFLAIYLKENFNHVYDKDGNDITIKNTWKSTVITMGVTFIATMSTYVLLWFLIGYGRGQLSPRNNYTI